MTFGIVYYIVNLVSLSFFPLICYSSSLLPRIKLIRTLGLCLWKLENGTENACGTEIIVHGLPVADAEYGIPQVR